MQFHNIKKNSFNRKGKQVGRGGARGKTSGRGTKGQNARSGRKKRPEMRDFIKKIPKLRGRGKNSLKSIKEKSKVVNLNQIEKLFESNEVVNRKSLLNKGILVKWSGKLPQVKILGGSINKGLSLEGLSVSKSAKKALESAGGKIV